MVGDIAGLSQLDLAVDVGVVVVDGLDTKSDEFSEDGIGGMGCWDIFDALKRQHLHFLRA